MKKVFASDFDGTMYFYKAEVKLPPENVEWIRRYQAAGNLFGLCTGRQVGGLTPFINGLVEPDFYITSTGANIVDRDLKPIYKRGVDRAAADAIVKAVKPRNYRVTLDIEGDICVFAKMDYPGFYYVIDCVDNAPPGLIHQLGIHTESPDEAAELSAWVNANFGQYVNAFQNVQEVDVAPLGCTKGKGVLLLRDWMREHYGEITLFGIGDSINDLPLLDAADVSYTFPYAPELVQKRATKVVPTIVDALLDSMNS